MRMHKGKDGRVRQLCGPGITILQGRAKKIHVRQRAPSSIEKKVVAPRSKLMWRRKEAPSVVSSQAGREGGCGVVGKQDLKTANKRDAIIPPPFQADPHALGTMLLEGGRMIWARRRRCSLISGVHQVASEDSELSTCPRPRLSTCPRPQIIRP